MIKMPDTRGRYFSVKHGMRIQGTLYVPSVCYPLPAGLQTVVEEMAAKGMTRIYTEKMRFVTGVPYPVKKPEAGVAALRSSSVSAPKAMPQQPAAKPGRKPGRKVREFN
jgi:hypothetical protein